jgi:hypothetical protein
MMHVYTMRLLPAGLATLKIIAHGYEQVLSAMVNPKRIGKKI